MGSQKAFKILTILLIMQWAFIRIIAQYPAAVENYYSNGLYIVVSKLLRVFFGWIPFSFGDILYTIIILFVVKNVYSALKTRQFNFKNTLFKIGGVASIAFFFFHFNWGINYFRQPLFKKLNIEQTKYTSSELIGLTRKLIAKTNKIQQLITKNDTIIVSNPQSKKAIKNSALVAYQQLESSYPQLKLETNSVKHSIFSLPLTYMGFAGYLNPITNEAQVNSLIPKNSYPATVCHELAHQIGIASESEANFVGYLAAINAEDTYFNYAGYLMALRYCLAEIYRNEPSTFKLLKKDIHKGILKDMQRQQEFWKSYQNWSEKYFNLFYDSYLKANQQKDGIKSYSKMVTLLINYYKDNPNAK